MAVPEKRERVTELSESIYAQIDSVLDARSTAVQPAMCQLWVHASPEATLESLLDILCAGFNYDNSRALEISIDALDKGKALCCVLPRDIAETKVEEVVNMLHKLPAKSSITCFLQKCRTYAARKA
jgi:ATP-dependent Clp protease adapter protein ClpS